MEMTRHAIIFVAIIFAYLHQQQQHTHQIHYKNKLSQSWENIDERQYSCAQFKIYGWLNCNVDRDLQPCINLIILTLQWLDVVVDISLTLIRSLIRSGLPLIFQKMLGFGSPTNPHSNWTGCPTEAAIFVNGVLNSGRMWWICWWWDCKM